MPAPANTSEQISNIATNVNSLATTLEKEYATLTNKFSALQSDTQQVNQAVNTNTAATAASVQAVSSTDKTPLYIALGLGAVAFLFLKK